MVGKWKHSKGATVTCTKISDTQVNCELVGAVNGLRIIRYDGSGYTYDGTPMPIPSLKLNASRQRELQWKNGSVWTQIGNLSINVIKFRIIQKYFLPIISYNELI